MKSETQQVRDRFSRPLKDLRISLTDRCSFRCDYCMPKELFGANHSFLKEKDYLSFDQILRFVQAAIPLGLEKVRLTGGEPLLRKNVNELVGRLRNESGVSEITLTTNGQLLKRQSELLKNAGLDRVNVSLDAIDQSVFRQMSGGYGDSQRVIEGIREAKQVGLKPKINTVLRKKFNESQILPVIELGISLGVEVRFIEFMDVGNSNGWQLDQVITREQILDTIGQFYRWESSKRERFDSPSESFAIPNENFRFGIISSITKPFCRNCVRARISSDGKFYTCLFTDNGYDMKPFLEKALAENRLHDQIRMVWSNRKDRYSEQRFEASTSPKKIEMSYIGG